MTAPTEKHLVPSAKDKRRFKVRRFVLDVAMSYESDECLAWPFAVKPHGYANIRWDGRQQVASRVICELAHGAPPSSKHHAAHSCGNRGCVNKRHLRWATISENHLDKRAQGTATAGERHPFSKLCVEDILNIRNLGKRPFTTQQIGEIFGIDRRHVGEILRGKKWGSVQ